MPESGLIDYVTGMNYTTAAFAAGTAVPQVQDEPLP